jgi:hypothetical protein
MQEKKELNKLIFSQDKSMILNALRDMELQVLQANTHISHLSRSIESLRTQLNLDEDEKNG